MKKIKNSLKNFFPSRNFHISFRVWPPARPLTIRRLGLEVVVSFRSRRFGFYYEVIKQRLIDKTLNTKDLYWSILSHTISYFCFIKILIGLEGERIPSWSSILVITGMGWSSVDNVVGWQGTKTDENPHTSYRWCCGVSGPVSLIVLQHVLSVTLTQTSHNSGPSL